MFCINRLVNMLTVKHIWTLILVTVICGPLLAQNTPTTPEEVDKALETLEPDDPILEALDNMITLEHFKKSPFTVDTSVLNIYKFPKDSVPVYDEEVYKYRLKQLDNKTPFSLVYNEPVKNYIEAYAVRNRQKVSRLLGLGEMYFPMIEEILDRYDMPIELKYLAVVESALNPEARSRSGAVGLWQFLYRTGKLYNLNVTSYIDERRDPYLETIAACEYLTYLYNMFGSWELALAAYNGGPGTLNKAIRRSGGKMNYWALRPYLPRETQGYVPAFIAVNYVMNYASEHNIYPTQPLALSYELDTVHVKEKLTFANLAESLDMSVEDISTLNPRYKKNLIPKSYEHMPVVLPREKVGFFITNEKAIYEMDNPVIATGQSAPETATKEVRHVHRVSRGENLSLIANRYRCTVEELKDWNGLRGTLINEGQRLTVYVNERYVPAKTSASTGGGDGGNYHVIQPGDTLWDIAKRNNLTVDDLVKLNNISKNAPLKVGTKLKVG